MAKANNERPDMLVWWFANLLGEETKHIHTYIQCSLWKGVRAFSAIKQLQGASNEMSTPRPRCPPPARPWTLCPLQDSIVIAYGFGTSVVRSSTCVEVDDGAVQILPRRRAGRIFLAMYSYKMCIFFTPKCIRACMMFVIRNKKNGHTSWGRDHFEPIHSFFTLRQ